MAIILKRTWKNELNDHQNTVIHKSPCIRLQIIRPALWGLQMNRNRWGASDAPVTTGTTTAAARYFSDKTYKFWGSLKPSGLETCTWILTRTKNQHHEQSLDLDQDHVGLLTFQTLKTEFLQGKTLHTVPKMTISSSQLKAKAIIFKSHLTIL